MPRVPFVLNTEVKTEESKPVLEGFSVVAGAGIWFPPQTTQTAEEAFEAVVDLIQNRPGESLKEYLPDKLKFVIVFAPYGETINGQIVATAEGKVFHAIPRFDIVKAMQKYLPTGVVQAYYDREGVEETVWASTGSE